MWSRLAELEAKCFCHIGLKLKNITNFSDSRINKKKIGENFDEVVDNNCMLNHNLNLTFSHDMHFNTMSRKLDVQLCNSRASSLKIYKISAKEQKIFPVTKLRAT